MSQVFPAIEEGAARHRFRFLLHPSISSQRALASLICFSNLLALAASFLSMSL
jgi:hypothetical protein